MVKVLENKLIDLDLLPGQRPSDLLAQAEKLQESSPEKAQVLRELAEQRATILKEEIERKTAGIPSRNVGIESVEQAEQQKPINPGALKGMGLGLMNTVGGLGKGIGDTLGNTVYSLGSGLGNTGSAVTNGLTQIASSAVQGGRQSSEATNDQAATAESIPKSAGLKDKLKDHDEEAEKSPVSNDAAEQKRKPRKIEKRSGVAQQASEEA